MNEENSHNINSHKFLKWLQSTTIWYNHINTYIFWPIFPASLASAYKFIRKNCLRRKISSLIFPRMRQDIINTPRCYSLRRERKERSKYEQILSWMRIAFPSALFFYFDIFPPTADERKKRWWSLVLNANFIFQLRVLLFWGELSAAERSMKLLSLSSWVNIKKITCH